MIKGIQVLYHFCFLIFAISLGSCHPQKEYSAWDSVDSNSVFILESKNIPVLQNQIYKSFFLKSDLYISSVQKSSKDDFDILYSYLMKEDIYDSVLASNSLGKDYRITNRLLNGSKIHEIKSKENKIQLSFTYLDGIFVLSRSSLLVENAIRVFENRETRSFKMNEVLFQFPSLKSDQGNIYLNFKISDIPFKKASMLRSIPLINDLVSLSVYDIKSKGGFLSLSGFSLGKGSSLELFQKQKPVGFKIAKYVPNYASDLIHLGISDFSSFKHIVDSSFMKSLDVGNEIAFISAKNNGSLVAFVELKPSSKHDFSFLSEYNEAYFNYQIKSVDGEMLRKGFGKLFATAPFGFCTIKDDYLFLTQSIEEMRSLIDAVENDDTWGKTSDYQNFSENGLQESNVTLIFKEPDLFSKDQGVLSGYANLIDSLGFSNVNWVSMQMSALDNHFYSSINFSSDSLGLKSKEKTTNASSVELPSAVRFISLVKNHTTGSQEVLVQDSDLAVYLVSLNEGIIWKRKVESQIQGSLKQLDYYNNGKLQYFFCSKDKLYVIDRLGRDVSGFPKSLASQTMFSDLVDYDKSKNYRFVVSSINNEVYLYDKKGNNLTEWGPKKFDQRIILSPQHFKIAGKDHFIIVLADGTVQTFSRKGDRVSLFKTRSNGALIGDLYIESGMSSAVTYCYYISDDGVLVKQNLNGEIVSIENILRGKNSKFILKRIDNREGFFIYRIDTDKIVVFDRHGKIVFEKQNSGSTNLEFQCIEEQNNHLVFSFYDVEQKLLQVFEESGNNLIQSPLESDLMPLIGFGKTKSELIIYTTSQNLIILNSIRQ